MAGVCFLFIITLGCGEPLESPGQLAGSDREDVGEAYQLIGGQTAIGDCTLDVDRGPGSSLAVSFRHDRGQQPFSFSGRFSNDQANRSKVQVKRHWRTRQPATIVLEKVTTSSLPARKLVLNVQLRAGVVTAITGGVYTSASWNQTRTITCR